jgi:hypothetical protein
VVPKVRLTSIVSAQAAYPSQRRIIGRPQRAAKPLQHPRRKCESVHGIPPAGPLLFLSSFMSSHFSTVPEAVDAVARGEIVIVVDAEDRENEGDFICAA